MSVCAHVTNATYMDNPFLPLYISFFFLFSIGSLLSSPSVLQGDFLPFIAEQTVISVSIFNLNMEHSYAKATKHVTYYFHPAKPEA